MRLRLSSAWVYSALLNGRQRLTGVRSIGLGLRMTSSLATFNNRNLQCLPVDTSLSAESRQVPNVIFSLIQPTPVVNPQLVALSTSMLTELGLQFLQRDEETLVDIFSGNRLMTGSVPAAHCYAGHQFGGFSGQLGDGAAISLGELIVSSSGARWELQLKGAGQTPYSRGSDGRKVLRSSIREFLCSEAMHALGIPSTRAVTCVTSDTRVIRDPFYRGESIPERCTIVCRTAENFFRFGSFEIFKESTPGKGQRSGPSAGNRELHRQLVDHVIEMYYPHLLLPVAGSGDRPVTETGTTGNSSSNKYSAFLQEIAERTARLVAKWQSVGFVHGVLNTDNMSIMGLTLDYGPFGFMEIFDENFVPNGSDHNGRYSYAQQPAICRWNIHKLAEALHPLIDDHDRTRALTVYDSVFASEYLRIFRSKLGLVEEETEDALLIRELLQTMSSTYCDFTDGFVAISTCLQELAKERESTEKDDDSVYRLLLERLLSRCATIVDAQAHFQRALSIHRLDMHPTQIQQLYAMMTTQPDVFQKMFADADIDEIKDEITAKKNLLDIVMRAASVSKSTVDDTQQRQANSRLWNDWIAKYRKRLRKEHNLCQSAEGAAQNNPTFVLRNWIAQEAIEKAEQGDYSAVRCVLAMLESPFRSDFSTFAEEQRLSTCTEREEVSVELSAQQRAFLHVSPDWSKSLLCTCSS